MPEPVVASAGWTMQGFGVASGSRLASFYLQLRTVPGDACRWPPLNMRGNPALSDGGFPVDGSDGTGQTAFVDRGIDSRFLVRGSSEPEG